MGLHLYLLVLHLIVDSEDAADITVSVDKDIIISKVFPH